MNGAESLAPECSNQEMLLTAMDEHFYNSCELASIFTQFLQTEILDYLIMMDLQRISIKINENWWIDAKVLGENLEINERIWEFWPLDMWIVISLSFLLEIKYIYQALNPPINQD